MDVSKGTNEKRRQQKVLRRGLEGDRSMGLKTLVELEKKIYINTINCLFRSDSVVRNNF
jgi:hypothetical protein